MCERLFFQYYNWSVKINGKDEYPHVVALFAITFSTYVNVQLCVYVVGLFFGFDILNAAFDIFGLVEISIAMMGIIFAIFYFLLVQGGKYLKTCHELSKRSDYQRRLDKIIALLYGLGSPILYFSILIATSPS